MLVFLTRNRQNEGQSGTLCSTQFTQKEQGIHIERPECTMRYTCIWLAIHSLVCIQWTSDIAYVLGRSPKVVITKFYCMALHKSCYCIVLVVLSYLQVLNVVVYYNSILLGCSSSGRCAQHCVCLLV